MHEQTKASCIPKISCFSGELRQELATAAADASVHPSHRADVHAALLAARARCPTRIGAAFATAADSRGRAA